MLKNASNKSIKSVKEFICELCDYNTSKKCDYKKHLLTEKHNCDNASKMLCIKSQKSQNTKYFSCECGKIYQHDSSYYRHKHKCKFEKETLPTPELTNAKLCDKDLIVMLLNDNKELRNILIEQSKEKDELKNMMMEVIKNGTNNITTNSHNKAFNLNFFLNETCKDAMNITEFVNSIQLQLSDLEKMGEVGYVEGLTSIISRNLKALDVNMRPVHCTDKKREIMYIKDETKWEKDEENTKMHKMVRNVAFENQRQILKYKEIHPDCGKSSSKYSDPYNKILVECMGGAGDNDFEKEEKIISKISKVVLVDKDLSV
jgi:hypothetical protein